MKAQQHTHTPFAFKQARLIADVQAMDVAVVAPSIAEPAVVHILVPNFVNISKFQVHYNMISCCVSIMKTQQHTHKHTTLTHTLCLQSVAHVYSSET